MDQNTSPIPPRAAFVPRTTTFVPKSTNWSSQSNWQKSNQTNSFQPKNNIWQSIWIQPKTQWSLPDSNDTKSNRKSFVVFKNDMIKARTIRLVDDEWTILWTYPRDEVLKMWEDQWLDVVQVHYDADTMICTAKMFDRGKYQYEKKKSDSAKRKNY